MNRYFLAAAMLLPAAGAGAADYLTTSEERPPIVIIHDGRGYGRYDGHHHRRYLPPPPPPRRYFRYDNGGISGSVESGRNSIRFNSGGGGFIESGTYDLRGYRIDPPLPPPRGYYNR
ncbi:Uncharacterised protein [Kingella potus]|uniref:Uncharacterized protein n=1 Tax=Kingella potus TaxID=265175 RepID=A0A377R2Q8_9NEIS|nr:hypothetical protein [Kingella potus]UOP00170.1 hypothetical protein LVJ84_09510 [Kingella potus]STR02766.1 Uncharacterised protein [Kingella potus]